MISTKKASRSARAPNARLLFRLPLSEIFSFSPCTFLPIAKKDRGNAGFHYIQRFPFSCSRVIHATFYPIFLVVSQSGFTRADIVAVLALKSKKESTSVRGRSARSPHLSGHVTIPCQFTIIIFFRY